MNIPGTKNRVFRYRKKYFFNFNFTLKKEKKCFRICIIGKKINYLAVFIEKCLLFNFNQLSLPNIIFSVNKKIKIADLV